MRRVSTSIIILIGALAFSGCMSVGPDYIPPRIDVPEEWRAGTSAGLVSGPVSREALSGWWSTFNDPILSGLIDRASSGNLDLKDARARVREARARRGVSRAGYFPTLDATGSIVKSGGSETRAGASEYYAAGFDAAWELDFFGGVRRSVEAADADVASSREDFNDTLISLTAEIALNYVEVRSFQARLDVAWENLEAQEETYRIIRSRFEAGLSNELPVRQAAYTAAGTRAQIPELRTGLEGAKNRLAVLLGLAPGQVHKELNAHRPIPVTDVNVAVGIPADILRRRPDVRRAERLLAGQTARIGVAAADLYPRFRLGGSIGLEALSASDLLHSPGRVWELRPGVSWNIFNGGAVRNNIEARDALREQALHQYQGTILTAFEEVENILVAYAGEQTRRDSLREAGNAAQVAAVLAMDQYKAGLVDFTTVLDAQRSALSYQDLLARSDGTVATNLIRLYKALGGGWLSGT